MIIEALAIGLGFGILVFDAIAILHIWAAVERIEAKLMELDKP